MTTIEELRRAANANLVLLRNSGARRRADAEARAATVERRRANNARLRELAAQERAERKETRRELAELRRHAAPMYRAYTAGTLPREQYGEFEEVDYRIEQLEDRLR